MYIRFHIHYQTTWGQQLFISGSLPGIGSAQEEVIVPMQYTQDGHWLLEIQVPDEETAFGYRYFVENEHTGKQEWEFDVKRTVHILPKHTQVANLYDQWHHKGKKDGVWLSSAFTQTLQKRSRNQSKLDNFTKNQTANIYRIQLRAPDVSPELEVCISGDDPLLGNWNLDEARVLDDSQFPLWTIELPINGKSREIEYKFLLRDKVSGELLRWEEGDNRFLNLRSSRKRKQLIVRTIEGFRGHSAPWKGAGVAIPVFSLRSEKSGGIGEFLDLMSLTDWAVATHLSLIQILPINDTIATHSWVDSYPYSAISVFALHPIYIRPSAIAQLKDSKKRKNLEQQLERLNQLAEVDYEAVLGIKSTYLKLLFDQEKASFLKDPAYKAFFIQNQEWLKPYAAFSALRDRFKTADFSQWEAFAAYDQKRIEQFVALDSGHFDDVSIHYFIQYHLHLQLLEASSYAKEKGVILKGDIPIGIYRHSVDAWVAPQLYHMNAQAGAPPDDFAVEGQNWRFPTYNWEEMAKDGFLWWKKRMIQLSTYFDAYRIDHILGFFRIWEIPSHAVQGLLGQFNPALPFSNDELIANGIWMDESRFCEPYIRSHMLDDFLGVHAESAAREFMEEYEPHSFRMKPEFATQRQIEAYVEEKIRRFPESAPYFEEVLPGLYGLIGEVLFFKAKQGGYCPRIALQQTYSYKDLDWESKERLNRLYDEFFYHRHEHFWREQAIVKLPAICDATDMLVCGEDLGMVPACVPGVMEELGLLSLEIQRMPKEPTKKFGHPNDAPYLSVVSPSSHDMPTIRGWWEQDRDLIRQFFHTILGHHEEPPFFCEPWVAKEIIVQHLYSPAMWAIFPIQDLLAMDGALRRENPHVEQINVPANPNNYWQYRFHLNIESLLTATDFTQDLGTLIQASGRSHQQVSRTSHSHSLTNVIESS